MQSREETGQASSLDFNSTPSPSFKIFPRRVKAGSAGLDLKKKLQIPSNSLLRNCSCLGEKIERGWQKMLPPRCSFWRSWKLTVYQNHQENEFKSKL